MALISSMDKPVFWAIWAGDEPDDNSILIAAANWRLIFVN